MPSRIELSASPTRDAVAPVTWSIVVEGPSYADGSVRAELDGETLIDATQPDFHAFVTATLGRPVRTWPEIGRPLGVVPRLPAQMSTVLANLLKAGLLVYQWLEPAFVARSAVALDTELLDQVIIDHTGAPGRQPFLYFLSEYHARAPEVDRLVALQLLCRGRISMADSTITRCFKPLAVPSVLIAQFDPGRPNGGEAYALWQAIRGRMASAVERVVGP